MQTGRPTGGWCSARGWTLGLWTVQRTGQSVRCQCVTPGQGHVGWMYDNFVNSCGAVFQREVRPLSWRNGAIPVVPAPVLDASTLYLPCIHHAPTTHPPCTRHVPPYTYHASPCTHHISSCPSRHPSCIHPAPTHPAPRTHPFITPHPLSISVWRPYLPQSPIREITQGSGKLSVFTPQAGADARSGLSSFLYDVCPIWESVALGTTEHVDRPGPSVPLPPPHTHLAPTNIDAQSGVHLGCIGGGTGQFSIAFGLLFGVSHSWRISARNWPLWGLLILKASFFQF